MRRDSKIVGMGGVVMQEEWKEVSLLDVLEGESLLRLMATTSQESNIYCSISGPNYPNYWVINGPRGNWGQGCALPSVRCDCPCGCPRTA